MSEAPPVKCIINGRLTHRVASNGQKAFTILLIVPFHPKLYWLCCKYLVHCLVLTVLQVFGTIVWYLLCCKCLVQLFGIDCVASIWYNCLVGSCHLSPFGLCDPGYKIIWNLKNESTHRIQVLKTPFKYTEIILHSSSLTSRTCFRCTFSEYKKILRRYSGWVLY